MTVLDQAGRVVARHGGTPAASGGFTAPHGIAVDSTGAVYVAEVTYTFSATIGVDPADAPTIQKLARR